MAPIECSVIVALNPHHNDLALVLESYGEQTAARGSFEVIVVNSGARGYAAQTYEDHRRRFPGSPVKLLNTTGRGRAAANNAGVRASRSDLLLFVGDDSIAAPTLVRAHAEFHKSVRHDVVVGIGPSFFPEALRGDSFRCWLEDSGLLFGVPFRLAAGHWPRSFFYVGNASIRRAPFERLGGFDDTLHDTGDDFEFSLRLSRAGGCSHFLPKAIAWHDHALTLAERAEAHRYAGGRARAIIARHGDIPQWARFVARPLIDFATAAAEAERRCRAVPSSLTRIARYQALLDFSFAQGFHGVGVDSYAEWAA